MWRKGYSSDPIPLRYNSQTANYILANWGQCSAPIAAVVNEHDAPRFRTPTRPYPASILHGPNRLPRLHCSPVMPSTLLKRAADAEGLLLWLGEYTNTLPLGSAAQLIPRRRPPPIAQLPQIVNAQKKRWFEINLVGRTLLDCLVLCARGTRRCCGWA